VAVEYWLDLGTLLGAVRDKKIIRWDYDVDLAMLEEVIEQASSDEVRADFAKIGYKVYNRTDFCPQKVKLTWDDIQKRLIYSSGFMSTIGLRIYNSDDSAFVDVYWQRVYKAAEVKAAPEGSFRLPKGYKSGNDLLCGLEGITPAEFFPGGCREVVDILPPTFLTMYGKKLSIPAEPEKNLEECFGPNWRTPISKGINALLCEGRNPTNDEWYAST